MADNKKKPRSSPPAPSKAAIYVEVDHALKKAIDDLARDHSRKLNGEVTEALKAWLAQHGRWPPASPANA